ncbi:sensor histidine kinase, partial [Kibdelosporangium lantanae]
MTAPSVIDPSEPMSNMLEHAVHILPVALVLTLPVVALGVLVLYLLRNGRLGTNLTVLVLIPMVAVAVGVLGVSGFMFNTTLTTMLLVCLLVMVVTVPAAVLIGRWLARRSVWEREA